MCKPWLTPTRHSSGLRPSGDCAGGSCARGDLDRTEVKSQMATAGVGGGGATTPAIEPLASHPKYEKIKDLDKGEQVLMTQIAWYTAVVPPWLQQLCGLRVRLPPHRRRFWLGAARAQPADGRGGSSQVHHAWTPVLPQVRAPGPTSCNSGVLCWGSCSGAGMPSRLLPARCRLQARAAVATNGAPDLLPPQPGLLLVRHACFDTRPHSIVPAGT